LLKSQTPSPRRFVAKTRPRESRFSHIDRPKLARIRVADQRHQLDGARAVQSIAPSHTLKCRRSNPYMVSYVKRAHTPCPDYFLAFLTLPLWTRDETLIHVPVGVKVRL
jgi:hypothetical protein